MRQWRTWALRRLAYRFLLLGLLILFQTLQAQILKGFIYNNEGVALSHANILIRNIDQENLILAYTTTTQKGEYHINLNEITTERKLTKFVVEVNKLGYESQSDVLSLLPNEIEYQRDFVLLASKVILEPIIVKGKSRAIVIKNDTVTYNPDRYKDGTERSVEDVLKKLPGMEVDDRGIIKYKGKTVEKVLLEGDDLFNYNYTVGTKNISADIIDKVQAIENWSENPLLKGIENSDKIALNLKLKKGRIDFSGNGYAGYGYQDRYQIGINGLAISKKHKNFSTLAYNNTGVSASPYDYFSFNKSPDEIKNSSFKATSLIPEQIFYSSIETSRANDNNNWFGSGNQIVKLSKNINAKINFNYHQDRLLFERKQRSNYVFENNEMLNTSENESTTKLPKLYDGNIELTWKSGKANFIEFKSKWNDEKILTNKNLVSNSIDNITSSLDSRNYFTKQELIHTLRLDDKHAIQFRGIYANDKKHQHFDLQPALDFDNDEIFLTGTTQQLVENHKENIIFNGTFLGVDINENKYQLQAEFNMMNDELTSLLLPKPLVVKNEFKNNIKQMTFQTRLSGFYKWEWKKWVIQPQIDIKNYNFRFNDVVSTKKMKNNQIVFSPRVNIFYKLNRNSMLLMKHSYDESTTDLSNLYSNPILTSFRNLRKNITNLSLQKTYSANTIYTFNDLYNQFDFLFELKYNAIKNNYFVNNDIGLNFIRSSYFMLPEQNKSYGANFRISKYFPIIFSTIKMSTEYNVSNYKNIINNSDLRDNQNRTLYFEFFYKTAFKFPVNFENTFKLNISKSKSINTKIFTNNAIVNSSKILVRGSKNLFASIIAEFYQPDTQNKNHYIFLDTNLRYRTDNNKWEFILTGKNLTNHKFFKQISISDYGRFESTQSLNNLNFIFTVNFQF